MPDEIIGEDYEAHNSLADATTLRAMICKMKIPNDLLLRHSFTGKWLSEYLSYLQNRNARLPTFNLLLKAKVISKTTAEKMAGSGLIYNHLKVAFECKGKDRVLKLLSERDKAGKVRVTNKKAIQNAVSDYVEKDMA